MHIPRFGLGTFRLKDQVVIDSVKTALDSAIVPSIPPKFMTMKPKSGKRLPKAVSHDKNCF